MEKQRKIRFILLSAALAEGFLLSFGGGFFATPRAMFFAWS